MVYEINLPEGLEVWLARWTRRLSEEEMEIYSSVRGLERSLKKDASLEELRACRDGKLRKVYDLYLDCGQNRFKPYFHARIKKIGTAFNVHIEALEKIEDLQGYVTQEMST